MQMVDMLGRQRIVRLFINLTRWIRTVHVLRLLPPTPPAQLLVPFHRRSPYPGDFSILLLLLVSKVRASIHGIIQTTMVFVDKHGVLVNCTVPLYRMVPDQFVHACAPSQLDPHIVGDPGPLFAADEAGHQQSEVEITLHFRGVEKRFAVPGQHLQELLDVYGLLQHLLLPGAIRCKSLEVSKFYVNCFLLCFNGAIALQFCCLKGL